MAGGRRSFWGSPYSLSSRARRRRRRARCLRRAQAVRTRPLRSSQGRSPLNGDSTRAMASTSRGSSAVGVGLNDGWQAGHRGLHDATGRRGVPDDARRGPRSSTVVTGASIVARSATHRYRVRCRSGSRPASPTSRRARSGRGSRTERTSTRCRTTMSSRASTRRASATRFSSPGPSRTEAPTRATASQRSPTTRRSTSTAATNTMDAAIALTTTARRGYGDASRRLRLAELDDRRQPRSAWAVQKYGRTTGFTAGIDQRGQRRRRRLLLPAERDLLLPRFRGALRQPVLGLAGTVQRLGRFGLAHGDAGLATSRSGCCSPAVTGLTIGNPIDPGAAAVQRHDRRRAGRAGPPGAPPACSATAGDGQVVALLDALRASTAARSITGYSVYRGTSPGRRGVPHRRSARMTSYHRHDRRRTGRPTTTRCRRSNAQRRGPALERGDRDPDRRSSRRRSPLRPRQLQPPQREPALGRRPLVERRSSAGRDAAITSTPTSSPARWRRPARPGATTLSSGPTSRSGHASRPCRRRAT